MNHLLRLLPLFLFLFSNTLHAQWIKTNGLEGGEIGQLIRTGDTIIAGTSYSLFYSTTGGQAWIEIPAANIPNISDIAVEGQTIVIKSYNSSFSAYKLHRSNDFGQTWTAVATADTMSFYEMLVVGPWIFGADEYGLYRTADDGANWEYLTHNQLSDLRYDGQRIIARTHPHLIVSYDLGLSWDTLLLNGADFVADVFVHDSLIFLFQYGNQKGVRVSKDYGQTWTFHAQTFSFDQANAHYWHDGSVYSVWGTSIKKSPDFGQTWSTVTFPGNGYATSGVSVGSAMLIGGLYSGVLRSTDGGASWFGANFGLLAKEGPLCTTDQGLYVPAPGGVYQLAADGFNWDNLNLSITLPWYSYGYTDFVKAGDNLIVSGGADYPWVSLDGGVTWYESFVASGPIGGAYFYDLSVVGDKVIGHSNNGDWDTYYVSDNQGLTFQPLQSLTQQFNTSPNLMCADQGFLYALGDDNNLYRSTDGSVQWTLQAAGPQMDTLVQWWGGYGPKFYVRGDFVFLFNNNYYEPDKQYLLFSNNLGATWQVIKLLDAGHPFGANAFNDLISVGNYLMAATPVGVFLSQDEGQTWTAWNEGLSGAGATDVEVYEGFVWCSVNSNGLWKRSLGELGMQGIQGTVFWDEDADGQQDVNEPGLADVIVKSNATNSYTKTGAGGAYTLLSNLASETVSVNPPKNYWTAVPVIQNTAVPASGLDFALQTNPNARDLSVALVNAAALRPGFETDYLLSWRNNVPLAAQNVSVTLGYPEDLLDLVSVTPAPSTQSGGTMTWQTGDVAPNASGNISIRFKVPLSDTLGTLICLEAQIEPLAGDLFANDNHRESCTQVVGSFDPNDKQSEPGERITPQQIADGEPVIYTVRFQNTGNYPATFVRITDTIQPDFDVATFRLLATSHPCTWTLKGKGEVEFFFNNIQLPPVTTDEPGSHGFVQYAVQPNNNLPVGTPLRNTAHIYFDYNVPVTTNTTETVVNMPDAVRDLANLLFLKIYPNPASDLILVETDGEEGRLTIFDLTGRVVFSSNVLGGQIQISVDDFPAGTYRVVFQGENGVGEGKLVVNR